MLGIRKAVILYAPEGQEYRIPAEELGRSLAQVNLDVKVKAAKDAGIPDILAADVILLGSLTNGRGEVHEHFAEIVRAFEGINLAGRLAGLISYDEGDSHKIFEEALRDTDISVFAENLTVETAHTDAERIKSWAERIYANYEARLNG
jgi:flavodoxin